MPLTTSWAASDGLADDQITRDVAASAKKIVLWVAELRGTLGTGHGRTRPPDVVAEHAEITADPAVLWPRWTLRRLDAIVDGRVSDIVRDLWSQTFYKGDLARRLAAANIPALDEAEQHRLGLAVGQRSARATFNVLEEGVLAPAVVTWPAPYRVGVVEGAFIDSEGYVLSTAWATRGALRLLRSLEDDGLAVVRGVVERAQQADISYAFSINERHAVVEVLADNTHAFDEAIVKASTSWRSESVPRPGSDRLKGHRRSGRGAWCSRAAPAAGCRPRGWGIRQALIGATGCRFAIPELEAQGPSR